MHASKSHSVLNPDIVGNQEQSINRSFTSSYGQQHTNSPSLQEPNRVTFINIEASNNGQLTTTNDKSKDEDDVIIEEEEP